MELTVTLAQVNATTGDIEGNAALVREELSRAADAGVDVVVFPELVLTGYCILDLVEDETFVAANEAALDRLAVGTADTAAIVGFVDRDEAGRRYNAAAVLQHGAVVGVAHKSLLPDYRYFDDNRYFEPARDRSPIAVDVDGHDVPLGVTICEDLWDDAYDRKPAPELVEKGASVILNLNASPFEAGKRAVRDRLLRRHVAALRRPIVYANAVGAADVGKNVVLFDGDSLAYDDAGTLLARGAQFEPDRVTVTVSLSDRSPAGGADAGGGDCVSRPTVTVPGEGGELDRAARDPGREDPLVGEPIETEPREQELFEALAYALRDYGHKTGFERVIEPISGGIDSSLGLAICVEAFGPEHVVAYNLPSAVNTSETRSIADRLAANFGVEYRVVPVQSLYEQVLATFEEHVGLVERSVARENVYARLRGLLMMLASNDSPPDDPAMLVSNGNETEMALGYATLYGDMSGGVDLLGDLSKTDVYAVARYVNERYGEPVIPPAVFEVEPSAELSAGQTDPFDYDVVAPVVTALLEERRSPAELVARFAARDLDPALFDVASADSVYERYDADSFSDLVYDTYRKFTRAAFKRVQASPIIAVSKRAFGTDLREPIINEWSGRPPDS
jgi:NAD+ synthase (glutamine-hydrolysing)